MVQAAIAVTVSAIRLFPMVVSVLPMLRTPTTKRRHLILAAHFIAVTLWVECFRFLPQVPRERRIAFIHGLGIGLVSVCLTATTVGYGLAANLPQTVRRRDPAADAAGVSALDRAQLPASSPMSLALVLGLALFPLAAMLNTGVDILISGVVGRHHRLWRSPVAERAHERFHRRLACAVVLLVAGFLPNEIWRMLGLWFGGGIDEGSELLVWVRAVATAILAGVIAQILVQPPGALASVPDGCVTARWRRICRVPADAALDFCRRGRRRNRDAGRQMVARANDRLLGLTTRTADGSRK